MVIEGKTVDDRCVFRTHYCVVGSGMGGAAVASKLAREGRDVLLVEAGQAEAVSQGVAGNVTAEHTGRPFGIPITRCIQLGGTSNAWHGLCTPLDEIDFEPRPWIGERGWPLRRKDLNRFYDEAARLLGHEQCSGLRPHLVSAAVEQEVEGIEFDHAILRPKFLEYRRPPHRWKKVLLDLAKDDVLTCLLDTSALELVPSEDGSRIAFLRAEAPGRSIRIEAKVFVICAGALETPRLLLNSRSRSDTGVGNDRGHVGRFLMDHPTGPFSMLRFHSMMRARAYSGLTLPNGTTHLLTGLTLRPELQERACVPNHYFMIHPCIEERHVKADLRLSFLSAKSIRDLTARQLIGLLRYRNLLYRILIVRCGLPAYYRYGELFFFTEQLPNPESRISLSPGSRDAFGYPVASIHWEPTVKDFSCLEEFTRVAFGQGLDSSQYQKSQHETIDDWIEHFTSAAHHLGTARMSDSPDHGVVDAQLKVFGVDNLYVCDGSVFPTAGSANPSLTITALGLRLADHLLHTDA